MPLIRKIKRFYNKTDMNYKYGQVDPFQFYVNFYYFGKIFQVIEYEAKPIWTYLSVTSVAFLGTCTLILCAVSLYHGIKEFNLSYMTEFVSYFSLMVYKLLILSSVKLNLRNYHNFQRELKEDFRYICNEGAKYRSRYFEIHLFSWKASLLAAIFTATIGICMMIFGILQLLLYLYIHEPGNRNERPLLFQFRFFSVDFGKTPTYEIIFLFECSVITSHIIMISFILLTNIIWIRQITSKADIIIWSIQDLLNGIRPFYDPEEEQLLSGILKERMRDILMKHQAMYRSIDDYTAVYRKILMYEQKLCGPLTCLTAYCTAEMLDQGKLDANSLLLFISVVVISFIPSYLCTFLADKVSSVCEACWDIPFWKAGPLMKVLGPYLVLIMQKTQRPLALRAPGFQDISIETYANNMALAYSWFNMLRQSNF